MVLTARASKLNLERRPLQKWGAVSLFLIAGLFPAITSAEPLKAFNAEFNVHALGMKLGVSKHSLRCEQENCTLKAISKPQGLAKLLLNESSEETIKLKQSYNQFKWLAYQKKVGKDLSDPKNLKVDTFFINDKQPAEIVNPAKQKSWPVQAEVYDSLSLAYAVQFNVLNQKPLNALFLQESKRQQAMTFNTGFSEVDLKLDNGKTLKKTQLFQFKTEKTNVKIWLLPTYDYFPARVDVYNIKKDKTLTLLLQEPPKIL